MVCFSDAAENMSLNLIVTCFLVYTCVQSFFLILMLSLVSFFFSTSFIGVGWISWAEALSELYVIFPA